MNKKYDFVVLGDLNLDYVVPKVLPFSFGQIDNYVLHYTDIEENYGGSGLNFCLHSQKFGFSSLLLSKVGNDLAGDAILNWIKNKKTISYPSTLLRSSRPTGRAIILRDSTQVRLLINNFDNANNQLNSDDISKFGKEIKTCKVLYISGYCINYKKGMKKPPRFDATLKAMAYAKASGIDMQPIVVFDVVPHRIYDNYSFDEFYNITKNVDVLISGAATVRRLLGLGSKSEVLDEILAQETMEKISQYYDRIILRFGPSGCDKQIFLDKKNNLQYMESDTGHSELSPEEQSGFGDKLTLKALCDFFNVTFQ